MLPGPRQRGALSCGRYLLAPKTGNKERGKSLMVLRVKPTPTRFPTKSLYTPMDTTPLHSISNVFVWGGTRLVVKGGNWHQLTTNNAKPLVHTTFSFTEHLAATVQVDVIRFFNITLISLGLESATSLQKNDCLNRSGHKFELLR